MTINISKSARQVIDNIGAALDIPESKYVAAERSYQAVGRWLERPGSKLEGMPVQIYSQGSFQLGTAIRPSSGNEHYDLDAVCEIALSKNSLSQKDLKALLGEELRAYAKARSMREIVESRRCWRLEYADETQFHIDVLPALPDAGVQPYGPDPDATLGTLSNFNLAITDTFHPLYHVTSPAWPSSNPRGYATWFRWRMNPVRKAARFDAIEAIPQYRERTHLQRVVQILKRHRDLRFEGDPDTRPISIIITTLAALSYNNESSITDALIGIIDRMDEHVVMRGGTAWVANPTNDKENFADKWALYPGRKDAFYEWLETARSDFRGAAALSDITPIIDTLAPRLGRGLLDRVVGAGGPLVVRRDSSLMAVQDAPHRRPMRWRLETSGVVRIDQAIVEKPGFRARSIQSNDAPLSRNCSLTFQASTTVLKPYKVFWQIVNTGEDAKRCRNLRGGFEELQYERGYLSKSESTLYPGVHSIECFVVRGDACLARSGPFIVNIG